MALFSGRRWYYNKSHFNHGQVWHLTQPVSGCAGEAVAPECPPSRRWPLHPGQLWPPPPEPNTRILPGRPTDGQQWTSRTDLRSRTCPRVTVFIHTHTHTMWPCEESTLFTTFPALWSFTNSRSVSSLGLLMMFTPQGLSVVVGC